ncbi:hypothetical protein BCV69DRAFT_8570 [Microstroma glucosiphilum]|uniref:Uncharacterized protein n=1 Tax=Pseudomicrostroma glucosiphilum TaxID=1684307 RepID=A0A316UEM0_9BASI|nr:hypothetical protein BCV69DRAFT_8570 [Pseudomicrostroma glucosiphilum]PWN23737.1 hypothetical protein BCV69DRAFT_8570 [Pseudomicrostroma glucosiphilum]
MLRGTSCLACQKGKRKCVRSSYDDPRGSPGPSDTSDTCDRCQRLGLSCSLVSRQQYTSSPSSSGTPAARRTSDGGVTAAETEMGGQVVGPRSGQGRTSVFSLAMAGYPTVLNQTQPDRKGDGAGASYTLAELRTCLGEVGIRKISDWVANNLIPLWPLLPTPEQLQNRRLLPSTLPIENESAARLLEIVQYIAAARHFEHTLEDESLTYPAWEGVLHIFKTALAEVVLSGVNSWDACLALQVVSVFRMRELKGFEDMPFSLLHSAQWAADNWRSGGRLQKSATPTVASHKSPWFDILWACSSSWQLSFCLGTAEGQNLVEPQTMPTEVDIEMLSSQCLLATALLASDRHAERRFHGLQLVLLRGSILPPVRSIWTALHGDNSDSSTLGWALSTWKKEEERLMSDTSLGLTGHSEPTDLILTEIKLVGVVVEGRILRAMASRHAQAVKFFERVSEIGASAAQARMLTLCLPSSDASSAFSAAQELLGTAARPLAQPSVSTVPHDLRMPPEMTLGCLFSAASVLLDLHVPMLRLSYITKDTSAASAMQIHFAWQLLCGCMLDEERSGVDFDIAARCRSIAAAAPPPGLGDWETGGIL